MNGDADENMISNGRISFFNCHFVQQ